MNKILDTSHDFGASSQNNSTLMSPKSVTSVTDCQENWQNFVKKTTQQTFLINIYSYLDSNSARLPLPTIFDGKTALKSQKIISNVFSNSKTLFSVHLEKQRHVGVFMDKKTAMRLISPLYPPETN
jgi:hypothetical protein